MAAAHIIDPAEQLRAAANELTAELTNLGAKARFVRTTWNEEAFVEGATAQGRGFSCMVVVEHERPVVYVCHKGRGVVASAVTVDVAARTVACLGLPRTK